MIHDEGRILPCDVGNTADQQPCLASRPQAVGSAKINRDYRLEREADIIAAKAVLRHSPEISFLN